jgi:hypothetical protein
MAADHLVNFLWRKWFIHDVPFIAAGRQATYSAFLLCGVLSLLLLPVFAQALGLQLST